MTYSPTPAPVRPVRVQLPGMPPTSIRLENGQRSTAKLQIVSVTGGLLRVLKPFSPGAIVELFFPTENGPVLGMAQMLSPCPAAPIGLQPFRFVALDRSDLQRLRAAISLCL
ncbi:MAG TPA: hypothetical protein VMT53_23620 [Terriglobales bacterium]|nr:hypothetical protein [Terriglobales bacterium]